MNNTQHIPGGELAPFTGWTLWWKWFNRAAIIGFLLLFRQAVLSVDIKMQFAWAALVVGNAWCHWKGKAPNEN